jgi:predicted ATP-grasp superfamily ATP-dependent carboligase
MNENQKYLGGELPYDHPLKNEAYNVAIDVVEAIDGLNGFVGVDLIITDTEVYFIEINSRFTTPYFALSRISNYYDFNILKTIVDLNNNLFNSFCFNKLFENYGKVFKFKKINHTLKIFEEEIDNI